MKQKYKEKHGIINRIPYMVIFIRKKGDVIEEGHFVSNFLFLKQWWAQDSSFIIYY